MTLDKKRFGPLALARAAASASIAMLAMSAPASVQAQATVPVKIYAQELVDRTVAQHPDLRAVVMHVTPPKGGGNVVIASTIGRIGKPADADDLDVIANGRTRVEMDRGDKRIEVELPLRDVGGETIGALGLVWRDQVGGNHEEFVRTANAIRDALARRILNVANLMDPYPYQPLVTTQSRAQALVDEALLNHPEVTVLAVRARTGPLNELTLLGSSFGRHGKKADADDLKVLDSASPTTGVYSSGKRFGIDLALRDRAGVAIGTMNVGYAYREGVDTQPLLAQAVALRSELQARIAAAPKLDELAPQPRLADPITLSSVGDAEMGPLMDAWLDALREQQPDIVRGPRWRHVGDAAAIGALMFELADVAPMSRAPLPAELAPYAHQFAGDMMKAPVLVRVAWRDDKPMFLAFNKRPDSPLPPAVQSLVRFALSRGGQDIAGRQAGFRALTPDEAAKELSKLEGYRARFDPALPRYAAATQVHGEIRSIGSDGMKSLMDRWMRDFRALQPGVRRGDHWEHPGTLNGFHALMAGETDLAPMGRELWPDEAAAYASLHAGHVPFEIRVARGGFNTQQRTTAQAVFVNARNPLGRITLPQFAAVFGHSPTITRWGQLGLTGEWADRPIVLDMPPRIAPNAMSMQTMALHGGAWGEAVHEAPVADTAKAIASDAGALGFGGFEDGGPGLKALAVARDAHSPAIEGSSETVASGRYPLTRYMYIRLQRKPGEALSAPVKEFLRYVLSRQGQEPILYSGYFPLTAGEVAEELSKLD